ncbi:MAG: hypothetical protein GY832_29690, partial [Chloroflexi bacterium]|nr:hypothetical protein [Chloroflexota bacterium]
SNARVQSTRTTFVHFDVLLRYLIPSSLLYLALPLVIFFVGWTRWYFSLGYVALIAAGLYFCWRETDRIVGQAWTNTEPLGLKLQHVLVLLLLALVLMSISGVGGYGYQDGDWLKHNAILKSLIEQPWPVTREVDGTGVSLVYYVAFYLPAALLGKLGGWSLANQALFAWAFVGLILAMLWFLVLARRAAYVALALFTFFSGLDVLGKLFVA